MVAPLDNTVERSAAVDFLIGIRNTGYAMSCGGTQDGVRNVVWWLQSTQCRILCHAGYAMLCVMQCRVRNVVCYVMQGTQCCVLCITGYAMLCVMEYRVRSTSPTPQIPPGNEATRPNGLNVDDLHAGVLQGGLGGHDRYGAASSPAPHLHNPLQPHRGGACLSQGRIRHHYWGVGIPRWGGVGRREVGRRKGVAGKISNSVI